MNNIAEMREVLRRHGFVFSKAMGQNFLVNPSVCPRMAACCGADACAGVLEIGPGAGILTAELAEIAAKVVAIELDERLLPVLDETLRGYRNVEIVCADILKLDLRTFLRERFSPEMSLVVCANLPYYITSPVLMALLEQRLPLKQITVMVQKEAAERLCAPVGSRKSGAVTVAVAYYAQAQKCFDVSRSSFFPPPNVDSTVIALNLHHAPPVQLRDEAAFFRLIRAAFAQRRKTAVNAVSAGLELPKEKVMQAFTACGLPLTIRAENLTLDDFARLLEGL
jgi:16S rRNA (adenine1518-N6/adenine1519-N6)-dimethyltransferase